MKLTDDPSIRLVDCPYCSSPIWIPCVVDEDKRISPFPADRQYYRTHTSRLRAALKECKDEEEYEAIKCEIEKRWNQKKSSLRRLRSKKV